jgi:glutamate-1-semialdehyde 2,1-aminomutase
MYFERKFYFLGSFPIFISEANGSAIIDVDGLIYTDFCLGDTGAMTGHSPQLVTEKLKAQIDRGFTTMLPVSEVNWVGEELKRRFKLPFWQICISATDANRFSLRIARAITQRPYVVVNNYCYHGTVDETFATLDLNGKTIKRQGSLGPQTCPSNTTRVVEYNDIDGLEDALKDGQVACVLMVNIRRQQTENLAKKSMYLRCILISRNRR